MCVYIDIYGRWCCLVTKSCPTPCPDCSLPGSSVHRISQARALEWIAISFSSGSSWPRDQTCISCTGRWILSHWATKEAPTQRQKEHAKVYVKVLWALCSSSVLNILILLQRTVCIVKCIARGVTRDYGGVTVSGMQRFSFARWGLLWKDGWWRW